MKRRMLLTSIVIMVTALVTIFSFGVVQSVMSMKDKPDALSEYIFGVNISFKNDSEEDIRDKLLNGPDELYIDSREGFEDFMSYSGFMTGTMSKKTFILRADIDGKGSQLFGMDRFYGTFDGNGHTIKNYYIMGTQRNNEDAYVGLFEVLDGDVKNLRIYNCHYEYDYAKLTESVYVGGVAGYMLDQTSITNCIVENCDFIRKNSYSDLAKIYVGGVVGYAGCEIDNNINSDSDDDQFFVPTIKNVLVDNFQCTDYYYGSDGVPVDDEDLYYATIGPAKAYRTAGGGDDSKSYINIDNCVVYGGTKGYPVNTEYICNLTQNEEDHGYEPIKIIDHIYVINNYDENNDSTNSTSIVNIDERSADGNKTWYYFKGYNNGCPYLSTFITFVEYTFVSSNEDLGTVYVSANKMPSSGLSLRINGSEIQTNTSPSYTLASASVKYDNYDNQQSVFLRWEKTDMYTYTAYFDYYYRPCSVEFGYEYYYNNNHMYIYPSVHSVNGLSTDEYDETTGEGVVWYQEGRDYLRLFLPSGSVVSKCEEYFNNGNFVYMYNISIKGVVEYRISYYIGSIYYPTSWGLSASETITGDYNQYSYWPTFKVENYLIYFVASPNMTLYNSSGVEQEDYWDTYVDGGTRLTVTEYDNKLEFYLDSELLVYYTWGVDYYLTYNGLGYDYIDITSDWYNIAPRVASSGIAELKFLTTTPSISAINDSAVIAPRLFMTGISNSQWHSTGRSFIVDVGLKIKVIPTIEDGKIVRYEFDLPLSSTSQYSDDAIVKYERVGIVFEDYDHTGLSKSIGADGYEYLTVESSCTIWVNCSFENLIQLIFNRVDDAMMYKYYDNNEKGWISDALPELSYNACNYEKASCTTNIAVDKGTRVYVYAVASEISNYPIYTYNVTYTYNGLDIPLDVVDYMPRHASSSLSNSCYYYNIYTDTVITPIFEEERNVVFNSISQEYAPYVNMTETVTRSFISENDSSNTIIGETTTTQNTTVRYSWDHSLSFSGYAISEDSWCYDMREERVYGLVDVYGSDGNPYASYEAYGEEYIYVSVTDWELTYSFAVVSRYEGESYFNIGPTIYQITITYSVHEDYRGMITLDGEYYYKGGNFVPTNDSYTKVSKSLEVTAKINAYDRLTFDKLVNGVDSDFRIYTIVNNEEIDINEANASEYGWTLTGDGAYITLVKFSVVCEIPIINTEEGKNKYTIKIDNDEPYYYYVEYNLSSPRYTLEIQSSSDDEVVNPDKWSAFGGSLEDQGIFTYVHIRAVLRTYDIVPY